MTRWHRFISLKWLAKTRKLVALTEMTPFQVFMTNALFNSKTSLAASVAKLDAAAAAMGVQKDETLSLPSVAVIGTRPSVWDAAGGLAHSKHSGLLAKCRVR